MKRAIRDNLEQPEIPDVMIRRPYYKPLSNLASSAGEFRSFKTDLAAFNL